MTDTITTTILAAAARPGGFTAQPLGGLKLDAIHKRCNRLVAEGLLFKARAGRRTVRWYATKEAADAAVDVANRERARRHEKAASAKPRLQDQGGELQYHPDFKGVQKIPGFEPRFQNSAGAVSFGMQRGRVMR